MEAIQPTGFLPVSREQPHSHDLFLISFHLCNLHIHSSVILFATYLH